MDRVDLGCQHVAGGFPRIGDGVGWPGDGMDEGGVWQIRRKVNRDSAPRRTWRWNVQSDVGGLCSKSRSRVAARKRSVKARCAKFRRVENGGVQRRKAVPSLFFGGLTRPPLLVWRVGSFSLQIVGEEPRSYCAARQYRSALKYS